MHECQDDGAGDKPGRGSGEVLDRSPAPRQIHDALETAHPYRMMSEIVGQDVACAALIASLENAVARVEVTDCPGLLGELERLKAILWTRMVTVSCGTTSSQPRADAMLLTLPQVAKRLAISDGRAYELARQGKLPTVKVGKYIRIEPAALDTWIVQHRDGTLDPRLYTAYSLSRHDRKRPAKTPQAIGPDPGRPGRAPRGHGEHRGPVGTRRDHDPGADGASDHPIEK
jgi:excisionase family DNA binding protein